MWCNIISAKYGKNLYRGEASGMWTSRESNWCSLISNAGCKVVGSIKGKIFFLKGKLRNYTPKYRIHIIFQGLEYGERIAGLICQLEFSTFCQVAKSTATSPVCNVHQVGKPTSPNCQLHLTKARMQTHQSALSCGLPKLPNAWNFLLCCPNLYQKEKMASLH
jgi:hypothetical protein